MSIQFQKLSDTATIPKNAHDGDAGYDLHSAVEITVAPRSNKLVKTNICVRLPKPLMEGLNVYGRVAERSGMALKKSIGVMGGVIDSGYKGDLGVILFNNSDVEYQVNIGDRIAQLIVEVCMTPLVKEVYDITEDSTSRGGSGFGSSGV